MAFKKGHKKTGGRQKGSVNKLTNHGLSSNDAVMLKSFYEKWIGSIKEDAFYVYEHVYNGECFYVGKGKAGRAWENRKNCRNNDWQSYVETIDYQYEVNIIACGLSEDEALATERAIISRRNPSCNIVHSSDPMQVEIINLTIN